MTSHPTLSNFLHWWLTTRRAWRRLHAVPGETLTSEELHDAIDACGPLIRRVACGLELDLTYPGLGSRFGMLRCVPCCRKLGIPTGYGTPVNEEAAKAEREREDGGHVPH